jgi:hypothetical protein
MDPEPTPPTVNDAPDMPLPRSLRERRRFLLAAAAVGVAAVGAFLWNTSRTTAPAQPEVTLPPPRWYALPPLPTPRRGVVLVVVDGRLLAYGGGTDAVLQRRTDTYDPARNAWERGPDLPFVLADAVAWSDGAGVVLADNTAQLLRVLRDAQWQTIAFPAALRVRQVLRWQGTLVLLTETADGPGCWQWDDGWQPLPAVPARSSPVALVAADDMLLVSADGTVWSLADGQQWNRVGTTGQSGALLAYGVLGSVVLLVPSDPARIHVYTRGQGSIPQETVPALAVPMTQCLVWRTSIIYADAAGTQIAGYQALFQNYIPFAQ